MLSVIQMSYGTISDEDFRRIFVPIGSAAAAEDPEKQIIVDPEGDGSAVSLEKLHFWEDLAASKEKLSAGPCRKKTMIMALWAIFGVYASAFMEIYIHETRFGGQQLEHEPLWDIYELFSTNDYDFDYLFVLTERSMVFFISCFLILLFFCENRHVIARRFMFFLGLIYFYRAIFITSTILPPTRKLIGDCSESQTNGSIGSLALRTLFFVFTGGFKMNQGGNNVCGGYLFSGHASIIILCSRFVCNYSSNRIPSFAKYALRILEVTCIVCIVLAREHYTIDVITAWFLMTREMWIYNSLLKLQDEKINDSIAVRNVWWAKFFVWIEADLPRDDAYLPKANF